MTSFSVLLFLHATSRLLILLSLIRTDRQVKESLKNKKMIFCGRTAKE
jgi:hypothetical protein